MSGVLSSATWEGLAVGGLAALYFLLAMFRAAHNDLSRIRIASVFEDAGLPGPFLRRWGRPGGREAIQLGVQIAFHSILILTALLTADLVQRLWPGLAVGWRVMVAFLASGAVLVIVLRTILARLIVALVPHRAVAISAPVAGVVATALLPVVLLIDGVTRRIAGRFHAGGAPRTDDDIQQEVHAFVSMGEEEGILEEGEGDLVRNVVDFGDTIVREVMCPRMEMVVVDRSAPLEEVRRKFVESNHSRLPVLGASIDQIEGVVSLKDLLPVWAEAGSTSIESYVRPVMFVPETKQVKDLLREMQKARTAFAIVIDEYGGTAGLVTIEDMVEEIVGEIDDEHDDGERDIVEEKEGVWLVSGLADVDEMARLAGVHVSAEDVDTVGGLVTSLLGRLPRKGEQIEYEGAVVQILDADERRVRRVRIRQCQPPRVGSGDRR